LAHGIKAEIIPKICEVWLDAEDAGKLGVRQEQIAQKTTLVAAAFERTLALERLHPRDH
jgi:hypothetical protein